MKYEYHLIDFACFCYKVCFILSSMKYASLLFAILVSSSFASSAQKSKTPIWTLSQINKVAVDTKLPAATLQIQGNQYSGNTGCNSYFGQINNAKLNIQTVFLAGGMTKMACEPANMTREDQFIQILNNGKVSRLSAKSLLIVNGKSSLLFTQK